MSSHEFETFLDKIGADGRLESHGDFTLDVARARTKLGQFALPEPGLWVVKLVQAAVAAGAPEIRFTFSRRKVRAEFQNTADWEAEAILKSVLSAATPEERHMMHLQTGLLSAASGANLSVAWSCGRHLIAIGEEGTSAKVNPVPEMVVVEATRPARPPQKPDFWASPVRYLFKQTALEYKALTNRCRCSPIPVIVDGYEIVRRYGVESHFLPQAPNFDSEKTQGHKRLLALQPLTCFPERASLTYPLREDLVPSEPEVWEEKKTFSPTTFPTAGPVNGVLGLFSVVQRESRINFLLDGAILAEEKVEAESPWSSNDFLRRLASSLANLEEHFVLDLYLETHTSRVDLSHFQVEESPASELLRRILPDLISLLEQLRELSERPWRLNFGGTTRPKFKNASLSDIVSTGLLTPFIPHFLIVGGVLLAVSPLTAAVKPFLDKRSTKQFQKAVDKALEGLLELSAGSK